MDRWAGKVAFVTGASSGIGASTSEALVSKGVKVVGLARRVEKLKTLQTKIGKGKFYALECDVRKEQDIIKAFKWAEKEFGGVDILVNNAGVISVVPIIDSESAEEYHRVIDTNLIAPAIFSREFVRGIEKRKSAGHIININSIAGWFAESLHMPFGMYCPSKYALRALGTELRHEVIQRNVSVKITNISPGAVYTEMLEGVVKASNHIANAAVTRPVLKDHDISDAIIYALGTPATVEIPEITVIPQNDVIGVQAGPNSLVSFTAKGTFKCRLKR